MEAVLSQIAAYVALAVEAVAVLLIAYGAVVSLFRVLMHIASRPAPGWRQAVWVDFGAWLLLGLQFALAADIARSVISPTWDMLGELAAIAAIRTFLNYFLEKDLAEAKRGEEEQARLLAAKS